MKKTVLFLLFLFAGTLLFADQLELKRHNRLMSVCYGEQVLVTDMQFYLADKNWQSLITSVKAGGSFQKLTREWKWGQTRKNESLKVKVRRDGHKLVFDVDYAANVDSRAYYLICDLFLDRDLFLEPLGGQEVPIQGTWSASNKLGTFQLNLLSDWGEWKQRDTSKAQWRKPDHRTITLLGCAYHEPGTVVENHLQFTLEFHPSQAFPGILRQRGLQLLAETFGIQQVVLDPADIEGMDVLEQKLAELSRAKKTYEEGSLEGIVIPQLMNRTLGKGEFSFPPEVTVDVRDGADGAFEVLRSELQDYRGIRVVRAARNPHITLGMRKGASAGYRIAVTGSSIVLEGNDAVGSINAIRTLSQLLRKDASGRILLSAQTIEDAPLGKGKRGFLLLAGGGEYGGKFLARAVDRFISRYKYNWFLFGEANSGTMAYRSHPEIKTPATNSVEVVDAIIAEAARLGLKTIPLVETFGHAATTLKFHPELADVPGENSFNIADPAVRKLLADQFDELVERFRPEYVHIGGDEAYSVARNPLCAGRSTADWTADHLNWCARYFKEQGIKVLMWHDMMLESGGKWNGPANSNPQRLTHPALDKIDKDIIIDYWSYNPQSNGYKELDHFRAKGFQVVGSAWYQAPVAIAQREAIETRNGLGTVDTSWSFESRMASSLATQAGADAGWNYGAARWKPLDDNIYERHLHDSLLPPRPSRFLGTRLVPHDIASAANSMFLNALGEGHALDFTLVPDGKVTFSGIPFDIVPYGGPMQCVVVDTSGKPFPKVSKPIPVGTKVRGLVFLHAARCHGGSMRIGTYRVTYSDGTVENIPLCLQRDIGEFSFPPEATARNDLNIKGFYCNCTPVWRGRTPNNSKGNLFAFEWLNPHPEKNIDSVMLASEYPGASFALLALTKVLDPLP